MLLSSLVRMAGRWFTSVTNVGMVRVVSIELKRNPASVIVTKYLRLLRWKQQLMGT